MPWGISNMGEDGFHILPTDEVHMTEDCKCNAKFDEELGAWVHNSFDGREAFEDGTRKPS